MPTPRLPRLFGIVALLLIGFTVGVLVTATDQRVNLPSSLTAAIGKLSPAPQGADYTQLVTVWDRLHRDYVNANINDRDLLQGAISGMVDGLGDPYSTFLSADSAKKFEAEISGTFEGVGMQVGYKDDKVTIIAPLAKSPAEKAGLLAGDVIVTVDGKETSTMTLDEVIDMIRGKQGTTVTLTILRGKELQPRTFAVIREKIIVDSVEVRVTEHQGLKLADVSLSSFNKDTGRELRSKLKALDLASIDGVLLDLRNNPGGYLDQAIDVASVFMDHGLIVAEVDRNDQRESLNALGNALIPEKKVVVLVDGGSASASEIVAGALQDSGRGRVVGSQTFGKGTVQDYQTLSDGSSLKITVAKWLTPKGRSISEQGITPDVVVAANTDPANTTADPQRDAALAEFTPKP